MKIRHALALVGALALANALSSEAANCRPKTSTTTAPIVTSVAPTPIIAEPDTEVPVTTTTTPVATTEVPEVTTAPTGPSAADDYDDESDATEGDGSEAAGSVTDYSATSGVAGVESSEESSDDEAAATSTPSASSTASASTASDSSASTATADHATFGTITSADGECVVGNPNAYISTEYVDWVWTNRMATDVTNTNALIFDQIHGNNGSLSYCVRWDSNNSLPLATASKFEAALNRQFKAWNYWMVGYDCWPFDTVDVKIVGIAVRDKSLLDWTDDSLGTIYEGDLDSDGVPQCPEECYKHVGGEKLSDTSKCANEPFDMSLWPSLGLGGGFGSWWGQEVDEENMLASIDNEQLQILAHEIGHGYGLPDFYETTDKPASDFPATIMEAGASMTITPGDGWMLRRVWEHIKSRYSD